MTASPLSAADIIRHLALAPHPEGGHYREIFRDPRIVEGGRAACTTIYFLLQTGERSHWHRVDAAEIWHFHTGAPLALEISEAEAGSHLLRQKHILGHDLLADHKPQVVVPAHAWQAAESLGAWTLCGCTVAPGFEFSGFELAPKGWSPGD